MMNTANTANILLWIIYFFIGISSADDDPIDEYTFNIEHPDGRIPGWSLMNKAYNFLLGTEIYEQDGQDIIDFQWTNRTSSPEYEIPLEFKNIPNISPCCDKVADISAVHYSSSSGVLDEQSKSSSAGYEKTVSMTGGVEYKGISASATTEMTNALMFGHSRTSRNGQFSATSGNTWSFSLDSRATLYRAEIDWEADKKYIEYQFKDNFLLGIEALNKNESNNSILRFFKNWGTHVLKQMETGAFCTESMYSESYATQSQVTTYNKKVKSGKASFLWWSASSERTTTEETIDTNSEDFYHETSNVFCKGEVAITSHCGGFTGERNMPIITSYALFPIWDINQLSGKFDKKTIQRIETFMESIYITLHNCTNNKCNGHGLCTLDEGIFTDSFINSWNGKNFSQLITPGIPKETPCFCNDGYYGNACNEALVCNPANSRCRSTYECGKSGNFTQCDILGGEGDGQGIMTGALTGSNNSDICPQDTNTIIRCSLSELRTNNTHEYINHFCGDNGEQISCNKYVRGSVMIGLCGTKYDYCDGYCHGHVGILCSTIDKVSVENNCNWYNEEDINQSEMGNLLACPGDGWVMTGYCQSGEEDEKKCDGHVFQIECCKLQQ